MILRVILLMSFCGAGTICAAQQQFPTKDEINLLLTQTERATEIFAAFVNDEERVLGQESKPAVDKDREVLHGLRTAVKALKTQPEAFNSPLGFSIQLWLDDADRNAMLCQVTALAKMNQAIDARNTSTAGELMELTQSSQAASAMLYTVSETASSLYLRYL